MLIVTLDAGAVAERSHTPEGSQTRIDPRSIHTPDECIVFQTLLSRCLTELMVDIINLCDSISNIIGRRVRRMIFNVKLLFYLSFIVSSNV